MSNRIAQLYASQIVPPSSKAKAVCSDLSKYDKLISEFLIRLGFSILRILIEPDEPDSADESVWDLIIDYFINTPVVVLPNGRFTEIKVSVSSGSYFTQLIDSVVNYVTSVYVQLRVFGKWYPIYVLGDDSIFRVPQEAEVDLKVFHSEYDLFGFRLSLNKSLVTTDFRDATFFGHKFHGTTIDRDDELIYELLLHPENPVENVHHSYSRLQSIFVDMGAASFRINDLMTAFINKHRKQVGDEKFRPVDTMNENLRRYLRAD